ncbi:MAG: hypothetical protein IPM29_06545 [Planctomycetes bacterium]|nr:hypothetical protein [Planctomycetota bacterium]
MHTGPARFALVLIAAFTSLWPGRGAAQEPADAGPLRYVGTDGPGRDRKVVLVAGDDEYRSEESLPQLARILAFRLGFDCTVLFSLDPETGAIAPGAQRNLPGLDVLAAADLLVLFTRFRDLPDAQMAPLVDYVESGRPIVALRTSTHAFRLGLESAYRHWSFNAGDPWPGGFGRQVLGETWIAHHGAHGSQSTRGIAAEGAAEHPILRGIANDGRGERAVWDPADVYRVRLPLPADCEPLLFGIVLAGMSPADPPAPTVPPAHDGGAPFDPNDPAMPVAWVRERAAGLDGAVRQRVFTTTLGAAQAFVHEGTRRLLVNACLWALRMEDRIEPDLDVALVGDFEPSPFGFDRARRGVRPVDLAWPR